MGSLQPIFIDTSNHELPGSVCYVLCHPCYYLHYGAQIFKQATWVLLWRCCFKVCCWLCRKRLQHSISGTCGIFGTTCSYTCSQVANACSSATTVAATTTTAACIATGSLCLSITEGSKGTCCSGASGCTAFVSGVGYNCA